MSVRERAVTLIRAARQAETADLRVFQLPAVNFGASHYAELINWNEERITQAPLLSDLKDEELECIREKPWEPPAYPVHTQAVERAVRTVTEAYAAVQGEETRHGLITAKLKHRQRMPDFNSIQDFR